MELDLNILKIQERVSLLLRLLYEREGFHKYHMGRFEEYGLYQENRRFLPSEQVISFTDLDGSIVLSQRAERSCFSSIRSPPHNSSLDCAVEEIL